ncbi:MAG TPA: RagB/SusD family nutrient uptake outer membrane protein [Gemmatimonadaceae bacterium]|nr:RagB/SusD family nutrient uptake outer membrane protein [Gemmatimonadaceae bacterium]
MTRPTHAASVHRRAGRVMAAAVSTLLLASCNDLDVQNINAPTADNLTNAPSEAILNRTAVGIQREAFNDLGGEIQSWGIYGRELLMLAGTDPRETGEEMAGPQDPGGRAGGSWVGKYGAILTINTYLRALSNTTAMAEQPVRASRGFAKTLKAWHLHKLAVRSGPTGLPIDVDRPISEGPAPLVTSAAAMEAVSAMLDEAMADLQAGGATFPFQFVPGYTGFTTPTSFIQFNRALAAKVLVHRATFNSCTTCWAQAATAMNASFVTTNDLPASLKTGVYYGYTGAANELNNPVTEALTSLRYWAHQSIVTGAQLRVGGAPDLRLTTKTMAAAAARNLNDITATHKPVLFNNPANLSAPDIGADIPWIINEELLLLRAEIRWNTTDKAGALADINLVRQHAGGLAPTTLTAGSPDADFVTELLYNRLYSLMFTQGTRWVDARRYGRIGTLPLDRPGDVVHPHMLIPAAECDARGLEDPCSIGG